ncbi:hypothetical protein BC332_24601 [Capsicum chinense]|nr:hypothetical protein BC332_24601 [Capsicum chinense]
MVPPLYGANATWYSKFNTFGDCSLVDILDSLLWISPQLDTLILVQESNLNTTLKFIDEDASAEGEKFLWRQSKNGKLYMFSKLMEWDSDYCRRKELHLLVDNDEEAIADVKKFSKLMEWDFDYCRRKELHLLVDDDEEAIADVEKLMMVSLIFGAFKEV